MAVLTETEEKLAKLLWDRVPLASSQLVALGEQEMGWKKSTTYTMLKRLERKGIFRNEKGMVQEIVNREDYYAGQSRQFVNETFGGSLPRFLTAFTRREKLSQEEIRQLRQLIDEYESEEGEQS